MSATIMRSALEFHGHNPAPDVSHVTIDVRHGRRVVTWAEVHRKRRERQAEILRHKRWPSVDTRLRRVWVAYFDMDLFGGWQAFIDTYNDPGWSRWIDRDNKGLIPQLLKLFPLVLPMGSEYDQWQQWKVEFAKRYRRGKQDRKPRGAYIVRFSDGRLERVREFPGPVSVER